MLPRIIFLALFGALIVASQEEIFHKEDILTEVPDGIVPENEFSSPKVTAEISPLHETKQEIKQQNVDKILDTPDFEMPELSSTLEDTTKAKQPIAKEPIVAPLHDTQIATQTAGCEAAERRCGMSKMCRAAKEFMTLDQHNIKRTRWAASTLHKRKSYSIFLQWASSCGRVSDANTARLLQVLKSTKAKHFRAIFFQNGQAVESQKPGKTNKLSEAIAHADRFAQEQSYVDGERTPLQRAKCYAIPRAPREIVFLGTEADASLDMQMGGYGISCCSSGFSVSTPVGGVSVNSNGVSGHVGVGPLKVGGSIGPNGVSVSTPVGGISITDQGLQGQVGVPGIAEFKVSINNDGFSTSANTLGGSYSMTINNDGFKADVKTKLFSYGVDIGPNGVNVNGEVNVFGIVGVSFEAGCGPNGCYGQGDAFFNTDCALFWLNMLANPMKALNFKMNPLQIAKDAFNLMKGVTQSAINALKRYENIANCISYRSIPDEFLECLGGDEGSNGFYGNFDGLPDTLKPILKPMCDQIYNSEIVAQAISAIANIKSYTGTCLAAVFNDELLKWTDAFTVGVGISAGAG